MAPRFFLLSAIFLWATAFVGIRVALTDFSPGALALFRFLVAGICLVPPYLRVKNKSRIGLRELGLLVLIGPIGMGCYSVLLNQSELQITAGIASLVVSLTPVLSSLMAITWLKEKPSTGMFLGILLSCLGLLLIAFENITDFEYNWAIFLVVLAVVCGAIQSVSQKVLLKNWTALELVSFAMWLTLLALTPYTLDLVHEIHTASYFTIIACIYLGIVPAFLAQWLWSHGLSKVPLIHANSYLFTMPLITALIGWLALGEKPGLFGVLGGLVALLGAFVSVRQRSMPREDLEYIDSPG
ncbi:MAG: EamA family transporter [Myxococcota bacterium]